MKAPMGGTVLEVKVKAGQEVKPGDVILIYEAMKMENNLLADRGGIIARVLVEDGDVMATDQPIIEFGVAGAAPKPVAPKPAAPKPAPAPKPVAAPAPAPKEEAAPAAAGVKPVDINRALAPNEGGTAGHYTLPTGKKPAGAAAPALRLGEGTVLEINVNPDGGINIRIATGK